MLTSFLAMHRQQLKTFNMKDLIVSVSVFEILKYFYCYLSRTNIVQIFPFIYSKYYQYVTCKSFFPVGLNRKKVQQKSTMKLPPKIKNQITRTTLVASNSHKFLCWRILHQIATLS